MKNQIHTYLISVKIILALFLTTSSLFAQDNYIYFTPSSDTVFDRKYKSWKSKNKWHIKHRA